MKAAWTTALAVLVGCSRPTVIVEAPADPAPVAAAAAAEDPLVEQEAVREAVRSYAAALGAREAEAAREWVVFETFGFYEDLRIAALRASREQLEAWDLMTVILILQIRSEVPRAQLEALDGRGLFARAVNDGLVGEQLEDIALDEVWIDEEREHAQIRVEGDPVVWLRRGPDDERWRVDIPEMIRLLGPAIEALARERVLADGKVRTALTFVELSADGFVDIAVLDGPLDE
ncbi:hypothetical protein ENSA5_56050 [Enhygromyxa salina]|uniref:Lipoprotein n=1 Tax=Enhygromyxa salina TaxID=215803 RepID=A0A2S9XEQ2_9BACT|nr:hypothetical protein [Enhygromyxa salina]PRP91339.1 hypothetical protein ENSA5_56050 [Enhygromyxa salina]